VGQLVWRASVPILLAVLIYVSYEFIIALQLNVSGDFALLVSSLVTIGITVSSMWAAWLFIHLLVETIIALPSIPEQSYDAHLLRLVARVLGVLVGVAILLWGANELGIPAAGVLAGLGVGGFALALAAQSTVENLFGGVSIFADRPFRVGDFIHYGNADGIVEAIGPRSARIRGLDGTLTTVPNADLSKMHITNYSMRDKCFFHHVLGVRYETTPAQFERLLRELRRRVAAHPMVEETNDMPRVRLLKFGSSSIDIDMRAYVLTTSFPEFLRVQEDLLLEIIKVVDEAGSGFAFPSMTAYLNNDQGIRTHRLTPFVTMDTPSSARGANPETDRTIDAEHHSEEGPSAENLP
jgi:MscS family membrane protein